MKLPHDPAIPLLGMYLKKPKTLIRKNLRNPTPIAALFTTATIWKQPIKKLWYIYTMGYYSAIKKTEGNVTFCDNMDRHGDHYAK